MRNSDAVVQFSAGWDSTAALLWSLEHESRRAFPRIVALFIDFGAPYSAEEQRRARALYRLIDRRYPGRVTMQELHAPLLMVEGLDYIASRNLVLGALSAHVAELHAASTIVTGSKTVALRVDDPHCYPDCTHEFYAALSAVASIAARREVQFLSPLQGWSKADVYRYLVRDQCIDVAELWTCYGAGPEPCGTCFHCQEAMSAIEESY